MSSSAVFIGTVVSTCIATVFGFQPSLSSRASSSLSMVAVDPTTVTKKEYEDICGIHFDEETLKKRLEATNFLYPKHVEVIEDIAPIAGQMVDDVVSSDRILLVGFRPPSPVAVVA